MRTVLLVWKIYWRIILMLPPVLSLKTPIALENGLQGNRAIWSHDFIAARHIFLSWLSQRRGLPVQAYGLLTTSRHVTWKPKNVLFPSRTSFTRITRNSALSMAVSSQIANSSLRKRSTHSFPSFLVSDLYHDDIYFVDFLYLHVVYTSP